MGVGLSSFRFNEAFRSPAANTEKHGQFSFPSNGSQRDIPIELFLTRLCAPGTADYIAECRLIREHFCNQPAIEAVIRKLETRNDFLSISRIGSKFLDGCDNDRLVGLFTAQSYYRLTEFESALETINRFPDELASYVDFASWHGFILEKLKRYEQAADAFQRALFLFSDLSNVHIVQFYHISNALKAAGKYCEAIAPLQLFVSLDLANRTLPKVERDIADLRRRGSCESDSAPGRSTIALARQNTLLIVDAWINGVGGKFILDTGASSIHLTKEFARRARISVSNDRIVQIVGVTGARRDYFVNLTSVSVGDFVARNISATIASVEHSLGDGVDGLLGQTFLGRFRYSVDSDRLTLRPLNEP